MIDHRGTPSSRPTSFKHSLAKTRASNDTTWPTFEPAPLLALAVEEACVGLPGGSVWPPAARSLSLPAAGTPDIARRSAAIHAFGDFRGTDAISQSKL